MKLLDNKLSGDVEVENVFGEDDGMEAGIDASNMGFMFDIVSNQMYSNPIGSLIRELTSNCFDSHVEAKVTDACPIVGLDYNVDEQKNFIYFEDFGVGISPDRMKKVYRNYFSSTKRNTNDQIGMFGLGSKSPLSYCNAFNLVTRFEGVEYFYVVHKGQERPRIELIYDKKTTQRNGTKVTVFIEDKDYSKFISETKKQLSFFKDVYFVGFEDDGIDNDYRIIEAESFKYRPDFQFSPQLHLCIGDVSYPIDFGLLGIPPIDIPVAVKFNIGEIWVNPQREAVRYLDGVKETILEKIKACLTELTKIYNSQYSEKEDDFVDWLSQQRDKKKIITLKIKEEEETGEFEESLREHQINITPISILKKAKHAVTGKPFEFFKDFNLNGDIFKPLEEYNLPNNPFFFLRAFGSELKLQDILTRKVLIVDNIADQLSSIPHSKVVPIKWQYLRHLVGDEHLTDNTYFKVYESCIEKKKKEDWQAAKTLLGLPKSGRFYHGSVALAYINYKKKILGLLSKYTTDYRNLVVDKGWQLAYNLRLQQEKRALKELQKARQDVPALICDVFCNWNRRTLTKEELNNARGFIIYGAKAENKMLDFTANVLFKYSNYSDMGHQKIVKISEENKKILKNHPLAIDVRDFLSMKNNRFLKRIVSLYKFEKNPQLTKFIASLAYNDTELEFLRDINRELYAHVLYLRGYMKRYNMEGLTEDEEFKKEVIELCNEVQIKDYEFDASFNYVNEYLKGAELLLDVTISKHNFYRVVEYLKMAKKRVSYLYYVKPVVRIAMMLKYVEKVNSIKLIGEEHRSNSFNITRSNSPYMGRYSREEYNKTKPWIFESFKFEGRVYHEGDTDFKVKMFKFVKPTITIPVIEVSENQQLPSEALVQYAEKLLIDKREDLILL